MKPRRRNNEAHAPDEHELIHRVQRGDEDAFATLFDRHSGIVFRYAWGLADARSFVDDLVQETFIVAWKRRQTIRIVGETALPWLLTTCRNVSLNMNREHRKLRTDELDENVEHSAAWYRKVEHETAVQQLTWVRDAISVMPDIDRRLCELCLLEGRTYEDAAVILGLTPASARKRIQRTRTRLRETRSTDF